MKVYIVQYIDAQWMEPLAHCVIGTFTTQGRALDECVDCIMERIGRREELAWSMAHDENHPSAKEFFSERRKDGVTVVRRGCYTKLREFLRDELGQHRCYYVYDGSDSWHFDIEENDVEGLVVGRATGGCCEDQKKKKED